MVQLMAIALMLGAWQHAAAADGFPPTEEFARRVRAALAEGYHADRGFTYLEQRREVDISALGKVTLGPLRTFEVYPAREPGKTYKRLIAVDGRPLDPAELAARDAEHARNLQRNADRLAGESPRQRAARLREAAEEQRELDAMFDDAVAVFEPVFVGRERIDGEPVFVVDLHPRANATIRTRQGGWMQHFQGRIWVAEADYQIVRLDMHAIRDITIGWGVIGRVDEGSRVRYATRRHDGVWLPAELSYQATGRTLLVRPFEIAATTTYSEYRRLEALAPRDPARDVRLQPKPGQQF
jgi:hypothetical protein